MESIILEFIGFLKKKSDILEREAVSSNKQDQKQKFLKNLENIDLGYICSINPFAANIQVLIKKDPQIKPSSSRFKKTKIKSV